MKKIIIGVFSLILATGLYAQTIGNEAFPQLKDGLLDLNLRAPGQNCVLAVISRVPVTIQI